MIGSGDDGWWRNRRCRRTLDRGASGQDVKAPTSIGGGGIEQKDNKQHGWCGVAKMEQEADATTESEAVDDTQGQWQNTAAVVFPHPAPPCASVSGMSPMRQEKEEERTMEWEEEAGKMLGVKE